MPSKKTRKSILTEKAKRYAEAGWLTSDIAVELGVDPSTIRRWLRPYGLVGKRGNPYSKESKRIKGLKRDLDLGVPVYRNEDLPGTVDDTLKIAKHDARLAEDAQIAGVADAHEDPKMAYKSFMVNMGMKKMRDGLVNMPPPRTVKEAEILDQIIRRNADMDPKRGGGGGTTIDISILNNPHTALSPSAVTIRSKRISERQAEEAILIESSEQRDEEQDDEHKEYDL